MTTRKGGDADVHSATHGIRASVALACVADKDPDTDWKTAAAAESCDDDTKMVLVSCRDTNVDCWGDCFECLDEHDFAECEIECACGDNKLFETELIDWQWSRHGVDIGAFSVRPLYLSLLMSCRERTARIR